MWDVKFWLANFSLSLANYDFELLTLRKSWFYVLWSYFDVKFWLATYSLSLANYDLELLTLRKSWFYVLLSYFDVKFWLATFSLSLANYDLELLTLRKSWFMSLDHILMWHFDLWRLTCDFRLCDPPNRNWLSQFRGIPWNQTSDVHRVSTLITWRWCYITWCWRHRNHAITIKSSIAATQTVKTCVGFRIRISKAAYGHLWFSKGAVPMSQIWIRSWKLAHGHQGGTLMKLYQYICADPENFVRGGPTLTSLFFFFVFFLVGVGGSK